MEKTERIIASPDCRRYAQIIRKGNKNVLIIDGIIQTRPEDIILRSARFSPDSKALVYSAIKNDKAYLVINGIPGAAYDDVEPGSILFSPNSKHLAFVAKIGQKWGVILDGRVLTLHNEIGAHRWHIEMGINLPGDFKPMHKQGITNWTMAFSPDSEHFAYLANDNNQWRIVLDNEPQQSSEDIKTDSLIFSQDSAHLAYKVEHRDKTFVLVDGREENHFERLKNGTPVFSPDGKRLGYFALQNNTWFAVVDGIENRISDRPSDRSLKFSPDSNRVVYRVWVGGDKGRWIVDGSPHKTYHRFGMSAFNPVTNLFFYVAKKGNRGFLVTEGEKRESFRDVGVFSFSPDGIRLSYNATIKSLGRKRDVMIVDGVRGDEYDNSFMGKAIFSPNSQRVAHRAKFGRSWHVVLDGIRGEGYQKVSGLVFGPDSKRLAYVAKKGKYDVVVVNDLELNHHKEVLITAHENIKGAGKIVFDSPNSFHYLARDKGEFSLHEVLLTPYL